LRFLAILEKGLALESNGQFTRGAQQQFDAEPRLQRIEPAPDDGRRHAFARAAADRLPRVADETKASICLSRSI
jgi:hypothetical protein